MAYAITSFDGRAIPALIPTLGSFLPVVGFKVTISGTTTSEAIKIPNLGIIYGAIVQVIDTNGRVATSDIAVSWSGNTLTLADGSSFNLDAAGHSIYVVAWGKAKV